jgi:hypothetical protein
MELRYRLRGLLTGEILLQELHLERPTIHLVRLRSERWNYEEVFRSGRGPGGASPRVELRNITIRGGTIRVDVPTTPKPPREPISRNAATPAAPEIVDDGITGFVCDSDAELVSAIDQIGRLDRAECRRAVEARFSAARMVSAHLRLYRRLLDARDRVVTGVDAGPTLL